MSSSEHTDESPTDDSKTDDSKTDVCKTDACRTDARTTTTAAVEIDAIDVTAGIPPEVAALLVASQRADWETPRAHYRPEVVMVRAGGRILAAALVSGRPHTAYRKIVDIAVPGEAAEAKHDAAEQAEAEHDAVAAIGELLAALTADAAARGLAALKFELHPWHAAATADVLLTQLTAAGFTEYGAPLASSVGTLGGVRGFVRQTNPWPHVELPYYGQTTDFTCGAVAGLIALERQGLAPLTSAPASEATAIELALWRQATNFPACEPLGLVVAMTERLRAASAGVEPEVHLSTTEPILLELGAAEASGLRDLLQQQSLERAMQLGIPVHRNWVSVEQIGVHLAAGDGVLLLIDERYMHDDETPHWVLAHSIRGEHVLVQDPWIDAEGGETWVDAHELPLTLANVDTMARYGSPDAEYRGLIVLPATRQVATR